MMPADPLSAYSPDARRPWTPARAAHLLRRAGFCPSEAEIRRAVDDGLAATVDRLVNSPEDSAEHDDLDVMGSRLGAADNIDRLRAWWLQRMTLTTRPLVMRMSVFWHDHFATSNAKVQSAPMMLAQLRSIEQHALGNFGDLLLAMSRDPAMIVWLDATDNVKGRPNENFAREIFELFSLGIGNYTETDIKEAARAFTGWSQRHGRFVYSSLAHDDGPKTIFGETGNFGGEDVVALCLRQPACSRFLATKLLDEFVTPYPDDRLVEALAQRLRENEFDVGETMRALLMSEAMFDEQHLRARIKSPVELSVGLVRSLELRPPAIALADGVSQMGQRLLEPASVKGWDGGRSWINATTMLVRMNAGIVATEPNGPARFEPPRLIDQYELDDREAIIAYAADVALDGHLPPALNGRIDDMDDEDEALLARALRVLVTSPEYQLA